VSRQQKPSRPHTGEEPTDQRRGRAVLRHAEYERLYRATIGDGNALAVEVNLFRHTYNTLRPHQALDERTPRAAYLAVEHCD
jgi:Integrase core domain